CRDLGWPEPTEAQARYVIGIELRQALRLVVPGLPEDAIPPLAEAYRRHYLAGEADLRLFPGIAELIRDLHARGVRIAVATGKRRPGLERALAAADLAACFDATRCADDCPSKPNPRMIEELRAQLSAPRETTLMVGDTTHDLQMAKNAGVAALAAAYGAHPRAELERLEPLAAADTPAQLALWLKRHV
ncbi:MAG: HAD-IA family hydrolase, partial [Candidatus Accumulibacter sp.]|nr:HAD-IA family hydrolase [Accumulibacter sp.]